MVDLSFLATISAAAIAIAIVSIAGLKAWRDWLELKRLELTSSQNDAHPFPTSGQRIEIADLKERVRKLEAIANGMDL